MALDLPKYDTANDRQFIFRHGCPYNTKDIHTMYNVNNSHGAL